MCYDPTKVETNHRSNLRQLTKKDLTKAFEAQCKLKPLRNIFLNKDMKVNVCFMIFFLSASMFVKVTDGAMFDFHVTDMLLNCTQQETLCRDIGYDGLAVISSPEAYIYALKLTR